MVVCAGVCARVRACGFVIGIVSYFHTNVHAVCRVHARPGVQVVPVIDAHFENAYSIKVVYSANDAVFERYMQSVKRWLHFKPTLVELGSAPLKAEHWGRIWAGCMDKPYVPGFTLDDLIQHNAFAHKEAISKIAAAASDEFATECQREVREPGGSTRYSWGTHRVLTRVMGAQKPGGLPRIDAAIVASWRSMRGVSTSGVPCAYRVAAIVRPWRSMPAVTAV